MDLSIPFNNHRGISSAHLLPLILNPGMDRFAFMDAMKARGIQTSVHYPAVHHFSAYNNKQVSIPQSLAMTEDIAAREVSLPLFQTMTEADLGIVMRAVQSSLAEL